MEKTVNFDTEATEPQIQKTKQLTDTGQHTVQIASDRRLANQRSLEEVGNDRSKRLKGTPAGETTQTLLEEPLEDGEIVVQPLAESQLVQNMEMQSTIQALQEQIRLQQEQIQTLQNVVRKLLDGPSEGSMMDYTSQKTALKTHPVDLPSRNSPSKSVTFLNPQDSDSEREDTDVEMTPQNIPESPFECGDPSQNQPEKNEKNKNEKNQKNEKKQKQKKQDTETDRMVMFQSLMNQFSQLLMGRDLPVMTQTPTQDQSRTSESNSASLSYAQVASQPPTKSRLPRRIKKAADSIFSEPTPPKTYVRMHVEVRGAKFKQLQNHREITRAIRKALKDIGILHSIHLFSKIGNSILEFYVRSDHEVEVRRILGVHKIKIIEGLNVLERCQYSTLDSAAVREFTIKRLAHLHRVARTRNLKACILESFEDELKQEIIDAANTGSTSPQRPSAMDTDDSPFAVVGEACGQIVHGQ